MSDSNIIIFVATSCIIVIYLKDYFLSFIKYGLYK